MHQSLRYIASIFILPAVFAANPISMHQTVPPNVQTSFQLNLPEVKASSAFNTLNFVKEHVDEHHVSHVRLKQHYRGFPVWGGDALLHSLTKVRSLVGVSSTVHMNGLVYGGLEQELGAPSPSFVSAGKKALEHFKARFSKERVSEAQVIPMIYVDKQHHAFWAYQVSVLVSAIDDSPSRPSAILDANTLKPFIEWNALKTETVKGVGYGGNPVMGKLHYGVSYPYLEMTRDPMLGFCSLANSEVKVVTMDHRYSGGASLMGFDCAEGDMDYDNAYWTGALGDGYDLVNEGYSPSNDALFIGQIIKHVYKDWYHEEVLMKDGKPMRLIMRVHYGKGYENAFWDGSQMTFGDGKDMFYPLVSVGIGAHEVSHGFTEQNSDLQYFDQFGGINEAFSDMASQVAENYTFGTNSWVIGSEVIKKGSEVLAIRYMDDPTQDGRSIDKATDFHAGMDVHYSSGVYNRLFYLLANLPNWDVRKAFHVMLKANMDYWRPLSGFNDAGCGIIHATNDLAFEVEDVKQVLDEVAVDYSKCGD